MGIDVPVNPYITCPKNQRSTEQLWEQFQSGELAGGELQDHYKRGLVSDWERCRSLGVSPTMKEAPVLSPDAFRENIGRKSFLMEAARQTVGGVSSLLEEVPGILVLTDEGGRILSVVGEPAVQEIAAQAINLVEGGIWSENIVGSNGIGTALARKAPVHVYASEHYCEGWHAWTCAAAPILDPFRDDVLGVVDFSTLSSEFRTNSLALAYSLATNITAEVRLRIEMERAQLRVQFSAHSARFPSDPMAVYDRLGLLVCRTPNLDTAPQLMLEPKQPVCNDGIRETESIHAHATGERIGTLVLFANRRPMAASTRHRSTSPAKVPIAAYGDFVTASEDVMCMMGKLQKIAATDLSVLLIGETGTGKELIAHFVHGQSSRRSGPFVAVNCGAISKELFESRFFGYEKGGFTGADPRGRRGLFECANNGTIFLDEIGELPLEMQVGLLRVLETGKFRRIGSDREYSTNCRVIAATNRPLQRGMEQGSFRPDLYYRLSVAKARVPPLRDRQEDVLLLVDHFTTNFCQKHGLLKTRFSQDALQQLLQHSWPGNARELRNVIEATIVCADTLVTSHDLPPEFSPAAPDTRPAHNDAPEEQQVAPATISDNELSLRDQERRLVVSALKRYKKISLAARALGVSRSTLYRRLGEFSIHPGEHVGWS